RCCARCRVLCRVLGAACARAKFRASCTLASDYRSQSAQGMLSPNDMCARRVEDLEVWQLANELRQKTYELMESSKKPLDSTFRSEIEDALASILKNTGEGFGRWHHKEFAQFLRYARGSTFEVAECVKDGIARGYWTVSATPAVLNLCEREQKALAGFIKYL